MRVLFISRQMKSYEAAFYQQDVIDEFHNQHEVWMYGPGFSGYNNTDTLARVLKRAPWKPDAIVIGHAWLLDNLDAVNVDPHPALIFRDSAIPVFIFLNKEYAQLEEKLNYIKRQNITGVFTHHHDAAQYEVQTGIPTYFFPFAVNHHRFIPTEQPDTIDLLFTGILRNPSVPESQRDTRVRIQKELFACLGQVRLWRKPKSRRYTIYWSGQASSRYQHAINIALHGSRRLSTQDYIEMLDAVKICLNTLSPLDLVSTRYFEAMAMKALVLCPASERYAGLFEPGKHVVTFTEEPWNFWETLEKYLIDHPNRKTVIEAAYNHVLQHHTWEVRVKQIAQVIQSNLNV